ncbi:HTH domain-containing protein [Amorphus orientalis]|uniref:Tetratricopeptide (TPR) repeat protein n=1 Tax=Amorphus orientalis TaxID=649198 RepID=A0AAE3VPU6_9HYPH|nr:HTH domain-containing protein [Amorphus orientalis]MDQ0315892.1 tetratricopeptide (TPR) repeat protein [Amorphus orientalis]
MDSLIDAAARALVSGDPLGALNRVALRTDAPATALQGIAFAQLGDLDRARQLLRRAARAFGPAEARPRARCMLAEAEIALVHRDLSGATRLLGTARRILEAHRDHANAAHATYLEARRLLLIGNLAAAETLLGSIDEADLPRTSRTGYWLVAAGIALRRIRSDAARQALDRAASAARDAGAPALSVEVEAARSLLAAPAARLLSHKEDQVLTLADVEALLARDVLIIDACRSAVRADGEYLSLTSRPVLFRIARALAEAWPEDVTRETLLARAVRSRVADESHRARLRVEVGRLRKELAPFAGICATRRGFVLRPHHASSVAVLVPPIESMHADVLALLADGEAWSSSALAMALGVSPRTVQRALDALARTGKVESFGHGRACRWMVPSVPGFPTSLLLPVRPTSGYTHSP